MGIAETLIAKLSNSRNIVVRPISAVRRYGALEQDPQAAGHELNVEGVSDGYIQRRAERICVTSRLLSVGDGRQLWAGQFDRNIRLEEIMDSNHLPAMAISISKRLALPNLSA